MSIRVTLVVLYVFNWQKKTFVKQTNTGDAVYCWFTEKNRHLFVNRAKVIVLTVLSLHETHKENSIERCFFLLFIQCFCCMITFKTDCAFMFISQVRHDFFCRAAKIRHCCWEVVRKHTVARKIFILKSNNGLNYAFECISSAERNTNMF